MGKRSCRSYNQRKQTMIERAITIAAVLAENGVAGKRAGIARKSEYEY